MMKFKLFLLIVSIALLGTVSNASCYRKNVPEVIELIKNSRKIEIKSMQYKADLLALENEILDKNRQKRQDENSFSVEYNLIDDTNTLNYSTDLSLWKKISSKKALEAKINIQKNKISQLKSSEEFRIADAVFSILSSNAYLNIFSERASLLLDLINYYETRINMGSDDFQKKVKAEQDLINLNDKKMSADIKVETLILQNDLQDVDLKSFIYPSRITPYITPEKCLSIPNVLIMLDFEVASKEAEIKNSQISLYPNLIGSASSAFDKSGSLSESASVVLNFTLYNGRKRTDRILALRDELRELNLERKVSLITMDKLLKERYAVDRILFSSLDSINRKVNDKTKLLEKLELKKLLGGSIFEEMTQTKIEVSNLREARVGIISDYVSSWIKLIYSRGDLSLVE
jgi:hypothetical protein